MVTALAVNVHALIACDRSPEMQQGHEQALRVWIAADPMISALEEVAASAPVDYAPTDRKPKTATKPRASKAAPPAVVTEDFGNGWPAQRIRKIRALLDMERDDLARFVGVSMQMVYLWESGRAPVSERHHERLAGLEAEALRRIREEV